MATNKLGYGITTWGGHFMLAHRVAWTLVNGQIPQGLDVCHSCDNPPCCNPSHFFLGTNGDNNRDKGAKHRGRGSRGEDNLQSKLTDEQVREIRHLYKPYEFSSPRLAKMFGVSHHLILLIVKREIWKHVP